MGIGYRGNLMSTAAEVSGDLNVDTSASIGADLAVGGVLGGAVPLSTPRC